MLSSLAFTQRSSGGLAGDVSSLPDKDPHHSPHLAPSQPVQPGFVTALHCVLGCVARMVLGT